MRDKPPSALAFGIVRAVSEDDMRPAGEGVGAEF
jgi:hypothetical protein